MDQWVSLVQSKCHYCSGELPETGCALDRMNSKLGYSISNVVPCCTSCNTMKSKTLTYEEMVLIWKLRKNAVASQ
jgi:hypothetical protein